MDEWRRVATLIYITTLMITLLQRRVSVVGAWLMFATQAVNVARRIYDAITAAVVVYISLLRVIVVDIGLPRLLRLVNEHGAVGAVTSATRHSGVTVTHRPPDEPHRRYY